MADDFAVLQNYLVVGALLFAIGFIGFIVRRNMIVMFLCAEMMLQGISISLVAWGNYHHDWGGQVLVIFIITVAACEAGIGLALILMLFRISGNLDITSWQTMREEGQPRYVDREIPAPEGAPRRWPHLTPAGIQPEVDPDEQLHRSRV